MEPSESYPPIHEHAAIGDGRTVALVTRDGTIDWLPFPDLDSPSVFAAILDRRRGGRFALAPETGFESHRRYLPGTNVLETTFVTTEGTVRVTDAMTIPGRGLTPLRELVRTIEGVSGRVPLGWTVEPRFGYGSGRTRIWTRHGVPIATSGVDAIAICNWEVGEPQIEANKIRGRFETSTGSHGVIALSGAHQEPLVLPARHDVEERMARSTTFWERWAQGRVYDGPWRAEVIRSALALKLLVFAPSGAIAAAPTTSLPEEIGGVRNWDYRFSWVRDSAFTMNAFLHLGCKEEAQAFFWWLMHASQRTHPRLSVLYQLDGGTDAPERILELEGYRRSSPVRIGNGAIGQTQLDIYGSMLQTAWLYAEAGHRIDREIGQRLADVADFVCHIWREPDSGLWEVQNEPRHFTQSKMMSAIALDRSILLSQNRRIPSGKADWRGSAAAIRTYVETRCWSDDRGSYVRSVGSEDLDASILLGAVFGYEDPAGDRFARTIERLQSELGDRSLLRRYVTSDGLPGGEGAFLACSFWLVEALARLGSRDDAAQLMEILLEHSNDVGLYAEEIDPATGEHLGNFPQGLTHLALINAAASFGKVESHR